MTGCATASRLDVRTSRAQAPIDAIPFHEWVFPDGTLWTKFYRARDGYVLRFPGLADFTVSVSGKKVAVHPVPAISAQTIEHLYLNQVLPLAMSRQWKLVLHASAVEVKGFAVAFLGVSGRGKSTLAASFATSGYSFLTDDGLQLVKRGTGYLAQASHASIRLWDDARLALIPESTPVASPVDYTPKARLLADDNVTHCDERRLLRCIYFLGEGGADMVTIEAVSGRDAMIELVRHSFLLDIEERAMLARHFEQLAEMAAAPMFFRLDFPRRFELLPAVRDAVVLHAAGTAK